MHWLVYERVSGSNHYFILISDLMNSHELASHVFFPYSSYLSNQPRSRIFLPTDLWISKLLSVSTTIRPRSQGDDFFEARPVLMGDLASSHHRSIPFLIQPARQASPANLGEVLGPLGINVCQWESYGILWDCGGFLSWACFGGIRLPSPPSPLSKAKFQCGIGLDNCPIF